eukprot:EG_transcript_4339
MVALTYGYPSEKEEERYRHQQVANAKPFLAAPAWLTHSNLCPLPLPTDLPRPTAGTEPMAYFDAYYHRSLAVLAAVADPAVVGGAALVLGGGLGGMLPVMRQRLPQLGRLMAVDLLPELVDIARQRYGSVAECVVGDVFRLQDVVAPGSFQLVYSAIGVEEYRRHTPQAARQIAQALAPGGLCLIAATPHPVYCPASAALPHFARHGLELVTEVAVTDDALAAISEAEAHLATCPSVRGSGLYRTLLDTFAHIQRLARQRYVHVLCVFRKVEWDPIPTTVPATSGAEIEAPSGEGTDQEEGAKYTEEVVEWYEQYELDGRPVPDWVRQLSYPCLPPPDMPAAPPVGENAHFYLDCFYHRILARASTVIDLTAFSGPCLFTGSGLSGMVPILRQRMPALGRLVAGDLVPFFLQIARRRGLDRQAELCVLDVLRLEEQFPPAAFAMVMDDAIVSHMRNDGGPTAHLFRPALRQVHRVLAPGGYFLPNGSLKLQTMQTAESVIADIEAEGFRLLTWEDLTQDCIAACDLMEAHILGSADHPGCLTPEDRQGYPELVSDVRDSFTEYYRTTMTRGVKGLAHWVFQKL